LPFKKGTPRPRPWHTNPRKKVENSSTKKKKIAWTHPGKGEGGPLGEKYQELTRCLEGGWEPGGVGGTKGGGGKVKETQYGQK